MSFRRVFSSAIEAKTDLEKNYINLSHPLAFSGINAIERWYGKQLSRKDIKEVLAAYDGYTLHREYHKGMRNPIFLYNPRQRVEIDLLDIAKHREDNEDVTFLVMVIDCWTRYLWVRPIKRKTADQVLAAVHSIFQEMGTLPKHLGGDRGLEFTNKKMQEYCRLHNISYMPTTNYSHAPFVERVNRTFQKLLFSWAAENETYTYLPVLQKICDTYNTRYHRIIKMTPTEAENPENHLQLRKNMEGRYIKFIAKKRAPAFNVGDIVRIMKDKGRFGRSYDEQSVEELFKVAKVNTRLPIPTYDLTEYDGTPIVGRFYGFELTMVKKNTFKVLKVMKTRTRRKGRGKKVKEYLVRWRGWSPKYDEWITDAHTVQRFR